MLVDVDQHRPHEKAPWTLPGRREEKERNDGGKQLVTNWQGRELCGMSGGK